MHKGISWGCQAQNRQISQCLVQGLTQELWMSKACPAFSRGLWVVTRVKPTEGDPEPREPRSCRIPPSHKQSETGGFAEEMTLPVIMPFPEICFWSQGQDHGGLGHGAAWYHSYNPQTDVKQLLAHLGCTVSHLALVAQVWEACASTDAVLMPVQ